MLEIHAEVVPTADGCFRNLIRASSIRGSELNPCSSHSFGFRLTPNLWLARIVKLDMDQHGVAAYGAVFHIFLMSTRRRIDRDHNFFPAVIANVSCIVVHFWSVSFRGRFGSWSLWHHFHAIGKWLTQGSCSHAWSRYLHHSMLMSSLLICSLLMLRHPSYRHWRSRHWEC